MPTHANEVSAIMSNVLLRYTTDEYFYYLLSIGLVGPSFDSFRFDTSKNGHITAKEFKRVLNMEYYTLRLDDFFDSFDVDKIDITIFKLLLSNERYMARINEIKTRLLPKYIIANKAKIREDKIRNAKVIDLLMRHGITEIPKDRIEYKEANPLSINVIQKLKILIFLGVSIYDEDLDHDEREQIQSFYATYGQTLHGSSLRESYKNGIIDFEFDKDGEFKIIDL